MEAPILFERWWLSYLLKPWSHMTTLISLLQMYRRIWLFNISRTPTAACRVVHHIILQNSTNTEQKSFTIFTWVHHFSKRGGSISYIINKTSFLLKNMESYDHNNNKSEIFVITLLWNACSIFKTRCIYLIYHRWKLYCPVFSLINYPITGFQALHLYVLVKPGPHIIY